MVTLCPVALDQNAEGNLEIENKSREAAQSNSIAIMGAYLHIEWVNALNGLREKILDTLNVPRLTSHRTNGLEVYMGPGI